MERKLVDISCAVNRNDAKIPALSAIITVGLKLDVTGANGCCFGNFAVCSNFFSSRDHKIVAGGPCFGAEQLVEAGAVVIGRSPKKRANGLLSRVNSLYW